MFIVKAVGNKNGVLFMHSDVLSIEVIRGYAIDTSLGCINLYKARYANKENPLDVIPYGDALAYSITDHEYVDEKEQSKKYSLLLNKDDCLFYDSIFLENEFEFYDKNSDDETHFMTTVLRLHTSSDSKVVAFNAGVSIYIENENGKTIDVI